MRHLCVRVRAGSTGLGAEPLAYTRCVHLGFSPARECTGVVPFGLGVKTSSPTLVESFSRWRWLQACVVFGAAMAWSATCAAQPVRASQSGFEAAANRDSDARRTTMARALFDEGVRLLDERRFSEAQDRFARVVDLRYSPVALYNLGLAQARCGRSVVAAATLRKLLTDPSVEPKVRDPATTLLAEVEGKFAWITIRPATNCESCRVYVDQEEWPLAALGVAVPIDAGQHTLELLRGTTRVASQTIELAPGARRELTLGPRPLDAARAAQLKQRNAALARSDQPATNASAEHSNVLRSPWFWGAMGVLVAGVATTIIIETR